MNHNIKLKVTKDYPSVDGMLYKNDIVYIQEQYKSYLKSESKIRVKDAMGKIYFVETKYLTFVK